MYDLYQVFDAQHAPITRKSIQAMLKQISSIFFSGLACVWFTSSVHAPYIFTLVLGIITLSVVSHTVVVRWKEIRNLIVHIEVSNRKIVIEDIGHQQSMLDWIKVDRIELNENGISIISTKGKRINVSSYFPAFDKLSKVVMEMAEFYDVPVFTSHTLKQRHQKSQNAFSFVEFK